MGILGNNGPIFPDTASKGAHFVQLCNQIDIPIIFLQNITGFVVGKDYERAGQIKRGAQFLNSVSNSTVPHLTVILGASYGQEPMQCLVELLTINLLSYGQLQKLL